MQDTQQKPFKELYLICKRLKEIYCDTSDRLISAASVDSFRTVVEDINAVIADFSLYYVYLACGILDFASLQVSN